MCSVPREGTTDKLIKVPSAGNPELSNVLPFKAGAGQNIACCTSFSPLQILCTFGVANTGSRVHPWNKIDHLDRHQVCVQLMRGPLLSAWGM